MPVSADIFTERQDWRGSLALSAALHGLFFGSILFYGAVFGGLRGESWGGIGAGGGAISATLVNSVPLPARESPTENILANESLGMSRSLPKEAAELPEAIPILEKKETKPAPERQPRSTIQAKPRPLETASNVVPFGQGGPVSGPYGVFSAGGAKGGFGFTGGGGDFGTRYAWYVRVVQQKISENWLKYEIDPSISDGRRVYVTFEIARSGQPANVRLEQSSGIPSLDQSAIRAVQRVDTFGPLPSDYSGSRVAVEFWFDYRR
jgi:protein TonB